MGTKSSRFDILFVRRTRSRGREYIEVVIKFGSEKPFSEMSYAHVFRPGQLIYSAGAGTDVKTLQAIAGHADIQMTMNRYVHKHNFLSV